MKKSILVILFVSFSLLTNAQNIKDSLGQKQGRWVLSKRGKIVEESYYLNDKPYGVRRFYNKYGNLVKEIEYKDGKIDGEYKIYKNHKLLSKADFKDGLLDGRYYAYYSNGKIMETTAFVRGIISQKWEHYDMDGKVFLAHFPNSDGTYYVTYSIPIEGTKFYKTLSTTYAEPPTIKPFGVEVHSKDIKEWMKKGKKEKKKIFKEKNF